MMNLKYLFINIMMLTSLVFSQVSVAEPLALTANVAGLAYSSSSLSIHFAEQLEMQAVFMDACEHQAAGATCTFAARRGGGGRSSRGSRTSRTTTTKEDNKRSTSGPTIGSGGGETGRLARRACEGKAEGDRCTYYPRGRTVKGNCGMLNNRFTCVSESRQNRRAACEGKQAGDTCTIDNKNNTCQTRQNELLCM